MPADGTGATSYEKGDFDTSLFWAGLRRAAAHHYLCICGTGSKAQWCSENLLRN